MYIGMAQNNDFLLIAGVGVLAYFLLKKPFEDVGKVTDTASSVTGNAGDLLNRTIDETESLIFDNPFSIFNTPSKLDFKIPKINFKPKNSSSSKSSSNIFSDSSTKDIGRFEAQKAYNVSSVKDYDYDKTSGVLFNKKTNQGFSTAFPSRMATSTKSTTSKNIFSKSYI